MLKWIGAGLIFSLSLYLGLTLGMLETKRIAELAAFALLLDTARESIETLRMPVSEIYASFSDPVLEKSGFAARLRMRAAAGECDALGKTIGEFMQARKLYLTQKDAAELCAFSAEFGAGDGEQEVRRCAYYADRLHRMLDAARAEAPGKIRIFRTLCPCAGMLCILLLL